MQAERQQGAADLPRRTRGGGAEQEGETVICERPVDTGSRTKVNKKKKLGNAALRGKGLLCDGLSALSLH